MMVRAEWPGYVMDVLVKPGQEVEDDEELILFEGTDEEHTPFYVTAPETGKVKEVFVAEGDFVSEDDDILSLGDATSEE